MNEDRAAVEHISIPQNQGYFRTIVSYDSFCSVDDDGNDHADNARSDLTGYTFRGWASLADGTQQIEFTVDLTDLPNGEFTISLDADDLIALDPFTGFYDIFATPPSASEVKFLKGNFILVDSAS